ncbi:MAG: LysR family transcriptional regulator [Actinomycetota bacterium]|nr:LysR family transcriptional regulator [Actinomycetota bacterium]
MLDVRRLEVLAAAVRLGSLAAAARQLGLTPGAASQAIRALEAQAGLALLERLPRGVRPTPAGERLAAQAEAILRTLQRAEGELAGEHAQLVRLAAFPTAVIGLVPRLLARLRSRAPELELRVLELEPAAGRAALRAGECELALVNHYSLLTPDLHGPWQVSHLRDEPVLAALPREHPLAGRASVSIHQLSEDPWITQQPASPCQEIVQQVCASAGFAPRVAATCSDYRSILALVGAGHGVSLIPELALTGIRTSGLVLLPTRPGTRRRINALTSNRPGSLPGTRTVLDALLENERQPD